MSIIIPVYKVERYIERCLLSVMRQNGQGISMECIMVDDCTPDNSMDIAERLISEYKGPITFHIIRHEQNRGLSVARNTGMAHATGDYLLFIDSDDFITDDCVSTLTNVVRQYPEVQVVKGNHVGRVGIDIESIPSKLLDNETLMKLFYLGVIPVMVWNTLVKRSLVEQWNLSFQQGMVHEDNLWSVQLFRHTDSFMFVRDVTYYYEENPGSILGDGDAILCQPRFLSYRIKIVDELLNSFDFKYFAPYTCYVVSHLMQMLDCIAKDRHVDDETCKHVLQLRNRLMKHTLRHGRLVLAVYELLLYKPFRNLMRYRWYRHNYNRIEKIFYLLAK